MAPLLKFYTTSSTIYRNDHLMLSDGNGTRFFILVEDIISIDLLNKRAKIRATINNTPMNIVVEFTQSKKI